MNSDGIYQIDFNVAMMHPKGGKILNQKIYDAAFEFTVESDLDGTKAIGRFGNTNRRVLASDGSGQEDASRFKFKPVVIEHGPKVMKIKIKFDDPKELQTSGQAHINLKIKELSVFKT